MTESKKRYVVTGHMAVFDSMTDAGRMRVTFYRGAQVPDDVSPQAIAHNLDVNLIAEVSASEPAGVDSAGAVVVGDQRPDGGKPGETVPVPTGALPDADRAATDKAKADAKADAEVADKRAAAKAKLPEDGSAPDGRASKDVLVEYLAGKGYDYDELVKQDPADLKALAKQQS